MNGTIRACGCTERARRTAVRRFEEAAAQFRNHQPVAAQAQLVMSISSAFKNDAKQLAQVQDQIDDVTTASCPKERSGMLAVLKMKTLAEAVR